MRGASALEQALASAPGKPLHVIVVWMPVVASDIGPPSTDTMARIPDRRVAQFWDPSHVVSKALLAKARAHADRLSAEERADVMRTNAVIWDFVALYPPGARWESEPPKTDFRGGPVVYVAEEVRKRLGQ